MSGMTDKELIERAAADSRKYAFHPVSPVLSRLANELVALIAERDALRVDAGRYRWLRDVAHPDSYDGISVGRDYPNSWGKWSTQHLTEAGLDTAIDRAIAAKDKESDRG